MTEAAAKMAEKWAALTLTKKTIPRAQDSVIACISKPSEQRRKTEIEMILPWFRKKSDLLRSVDKEVLIEIIRRCQYKKAIPNEVIIKQGDIGDCFYIMLTGKTSVYIDTAKSDDDPPHSNDVSTDSAREKAVNVISALSGFSTSKLKTVKDRTTLGKFIICFDAGKSFGEIALISEDSVRNASIVADEDTDLLVVHRDLFNSTLKAKQEQEYQERKDFVDSNPLFRHWNAKFKRLLEMSLRKEVLPFDTRIVTQGQPIVGLHFIIKGQAKVTVVPSNHRRQFPRLFDDVNIYDIQKRSGKQETTKGRTPTEHVCTQNQIRIRRNEGYAAAERRLAHKQVNLCSVEENEVIGDVEMVFDMATYLQTVTCTSNTVVMILDVKNYERLITKKNPQTIDQMRNTIEAKLRGKLRSSNGAQISLFKNVIEKIESLKPSKRQQAVVEEEMLEKDDMYTQLIDLYLEDKVSTLVDPVVPNAVFYRYKTVQKRKAKEAWEKRMSSVGSAGQVKWTDARRRENSRRSTRRPRSRRELQSITIGPPPGQFRNRPGTAPPRVRNRDIDSNDANVGDKTFITELPEGIIHGNEGNHSQNVEEKSSGLKFIQNGRHVTTPAEEDDVYFDMETSHSVLADLEQRLHLFHARMCENERRQTTRVTELKRFQVQNALSVPVPGGTVYVKRKPCKFASKQPKTYGDDPHSTHEHVRRFMLPKNSFVNGTMINVDQQKLVANGLVPEVNNNSDSSEMSWVEDDQPLSRSESPKTEKPNRRPRPVTACARLVSAN